MEVAVLRDGIRALISTSGCVSQNCRHVYVVPSWAVKHFFLPSAHFLWDEQGVTPDRAKTVRWIRQDVSNGRATRAGSRNRGRAGEAGRRGRGALSRAG